MKQNQEYIAAMFHQMLRMWTLLQTINNATTITSSISPDELLMQECELESLSTSQRATPLSTFQFPQPPTQIFLTRAKSYQNPFPT
jgi:hypothetical protein